MMYSGLYQYTRMVLYNLPNNNFSVHIRLITQAQNELYIEIFKQNQMNQSITKAVKAFPSGLPTMQK